MPNPIEYFKLQFLMIAISVAGAFAKYSTLILSGEKFSWKMLVATFFLSVFSGIVFGSFAKSLGLPVDWVIIASAIGSYMSKESLDFVYERFKGKTNI